MGRKHSHHRPSLVLWGLLVVGCVGGDTGEPAAPGGEGSDATSAWAPDDPGTTGSTTTEGSSATSGSTGADDGSTSTGPASDTDPDCTFVPHPALAELPDNTALDLGRYTCADRMPEIANNCEKIFDYSRINYDPYHHRVLVFGGGHAASGRTDVDVFDLMSLSWSSLYPSMSCEDVAAGDIDPRGFHNATGHPVARHSYDQNVIAEVDGVGRLMMFSNEGFAGSCHSYNAPIRSVASLALSGTTTTWTYGAESPLPWQYAGAAEFDPVSGMVILLGGGSSGSPNGMWVYDPSADQVVASMGVPGMKLNSVLMYDPPSDRMIYMRGSNDPLDALEVVLDRNDWEASTITPLLFEGGTPPAGRPFAYDSTNRVIGTIRESTFHAFDLTNNTWSSQTIEVSSEDPEATVGNVHSLALDYDPVDNVFIAVANGAAGKRTWAYRYRGGAKACPGG